MQSKFDGKFDSVVDKPLTPSQQARNAMEAAVCLIENEMSNHDGPRKFVMSMAVAILMDGVERSKAHDKRDGTDGH